MRKPMIFISDFDGTMSTLDFYLLMLEKYHPVGYDQMLLDKVRCGSMTSFEYLNEILSTVNKSFEELMRDVESVTLDPAVVPFVSLLEKSGIDFIVVSAGNSFYVDYIVKKYLGKEIPVIANPGEYRNGGFYMHKDTEHPYFCSKFGINKEKVVKYYRQFYDTVLFAGDSTPDYKAGKASDIVFAKGLLKKYYTRDNVPFYEYETFEDIRRIVCERYSTLFSEE